VLSGRSSFRAWTAGPGEEQERGADHDAAVRDVEHGPHLEVEEVDDLTRKPRPTCEPVGEVAQRAAEHQSQGHRAGERRRPPGGDQDDHDDHEAGSDEQPRRSTEQAERPTGVGGETELEDAGDDLDGRPSLQVPFRQELGQAIEDVDAGADPVEKDREVPLQGEPSYRARSSACLSLMQRLA
jgi:hypothetical protein